MDKILIVGRSNVGKSSLIESLTGQKVKVGKKPGITLSFNEYRYRNFILVDFPGFGFMQNVKKDKQEHLKENIVKYIESGDFNRVLEVIDAKAFLEIYERWVNIQIPLEVEFYQFLSEYTKPIIVVNKIDKLKKYKRNETFNGIAERFGLGIPWNSNQNFIPISAKTKENMEALKNVLIG